MDQWMIYNTGLYTRLSDEDGDKKESDSIANQKKLIMEYLRDKPEFKILDTYVDDGHTGTNFERPAFLRLLKDIEAKKINCVVVKDLSRFGRNYVEAGRYIERIFPMLGVRFIAINDNYDSLDKNAASELLVPFKNLMNDAYSGDISKKVKSSLRVKKQQGEFVGAFAAYGYVKSKNDKHRLEIDEDVKEVIRLIYGLKGQGFSDNAIASVLNNRGILSPMAYKQKQELKYESGFSTGKQPKWWAKTVGRILEDEIYQGVLEQGKTYAPSYKLQIRLKCKKEEQIRVEHAHPAIISNQECKDASRFRTVDLRNGNGLSQPYLMSGIVQCGDCGQSMIRKSISKRGKTYVYYVCSAHKTDKTVCSTHNISEEVLQGALLEIINKAVIALVQQGVFLKQYEKEAKAEYAICKLNKEIRYLETEIDHCREREKSLWEDYQEELLTKREYHRLKSIYESKLAVYHTDIKKLEEVIRSYSDHIEDVYKWLEHITTFQSITVLDRKLLLYLVDRIYIFENKGVEVMFKYKDALQEIEEFAQFVEKQGDTVYA